MLLIWSLVSRISPSAVVSVDGVLPRLVKSTDREAITSSIVPSIKV